MKLNIHPKCLIIIRGVPGAGKTTLAQDIIVQTASRGLTSVILETDQYFTETDGTYNWDISKTAEAHDDTQNRCVEALDESTACIIVSNTSIKIAHMQPYMDMARAAGYEFKLLHKTVAGPMLASSRGIHAVPAEVTERMYETYEPCEGDIKISDADTVNVTVLT